MLTARNGQRGCDIVAEKAGRRLRVEVKADRSGHDYAIAILPVHTPLITPTLAVLARLSVKAFLVEDDGTVRGRGAD